MGMAQVHRFHDRVAVSLPGKGETVYLTAKEAFKLARVIHAAARDVNARGFIESTFDTVEIEVKQP